MDKMTFASYKFKPSDVIEGLNRYFAETKANRYLRAPLEIRNGVWTSDPDYRKDIVFINSYSDASVTTEASGRGWKYYLVCDPEEVVGVAINWLREEHDIFYTPGMEAPGEDFDVDEAAKKYEKETRTSDIFCEGNLDVVPVAKVREALGIAEDSDIFEAIAVLKKSDEREHSEMYKARGEKYELERRVREILGINREVNFFEALRHARGDIDATTRLRRESADLRHQNHQFGRRLADIRKAAGMADDDHGDLVKYVETLRKSEEWYEDLYKQYEKMYCELRDAKSTRLSAERTNYKRCYESLKNGILEVYREIFDCSNGDPEGTIKETLQDILTEYKRTLELKNKAEEKTIEWKELALENEEKED